MRPLQTPFSTLLICSLVISILNLGSSAFGATDFETKISAKPLPFSERISQERFDFQGGNSLTDRMRIVPGLQTQSTGSAGVPQGAYWMGSGTDQVTYLLDGFELNDPTTPSGQFDLANLTSGIVDSVTLFKGSQSSRFGSQGFSGVVQLWTREGLDGPKSNQVELGLGEQEWAHTRLSLGNYRHSLHLGFERQNSKSIERQSFPPHEKDSFHRSFQLGKTRQSTPVGVVQLQALSFQGQTDEDSFDLNGKLMDDDNSTSTYSRLGGLIEFEPHFMDWKSSIQLNRWQRRHQDGPSWAGDMGQDLAYQSEERAFKLSRMKTEKWNLDFVAKDLATQMVENTTFESVISRKTYSHEAFGSYQFLPTQNLEVRPGGAWVCFSNCWFQPHLFSKMNLSQGWLGLQLAQAEREATTYQKWSIYGDPNLERESVESLILDHLHDFENSSVKISLFEQRFKNLLAFDGSKSKYVSRDKVLIQGVTMELNSEIQDQKFQFHWTWLSAKDVVTSENLPRRSPQFGVFEWSPPVGWGDLAFQFEHRQSAQDFNQERISDRNEVHLLLKQTISDHLRMKMTLRNLTDEKGGAIAPYPPPERFVEARLEADF